MTTKSGADQPSIQRRKADHLALCVTDDVRFRATGPLFDQVRFVHDALPDGHFDDVDLATPLLGKTMAAPVVISAMTGGTPAAREVNRDLARAAEALSLGFGLGSQRPMLLDRSVTSTYQVRDVAP